MQYEVFFYRAADLEVKTECRSVHIDFVSGIITSINSAGNGPKADGIIEAMVCFLLRLGGQGKNSVEDEHE